MINLHWETISPDMRPVMAGFSQSELGSRFYLAGGTALALQLGHRKSFDPLLADAAWGNLVFLANGVRVGFKDFHDLYAICQHITLRGLLNYAPQKYPDIRDFEAQVVRRLAYFKYAELEEPVPLLQAVPWEEVKQYFREQAVSLAKGWIE